MKFIRSLPLMWASTRWPFSSSTANMVLGRGSITVPSTSIASRLATGYVLPFLTHSAGPSGPTHERVAYQTYPFQATVRSWLVSVPMSVLAAAPTRQVDRRHVAGVHMNHIPMAWGASGTTPGWSAEAGSNKHVPSVARQPQ